LAVGIWQGRPARTGRVVSTAVATVLALALSGCWWTQPGFGPERTFANPDEPRLTADTIGDVTELWPGLLGEAVVAGGSIYATADGQVTAYDARTGAVRWQHPLFSLTFRSSPVLHDGVVYVSGYAERLACVTEPWPVCAYLPSDIGVRRFDAATGDELPILPWNGTSYGPDGPMAATGHHLVTAQGWFPPRGGPGTWPADSYQVFDLTGATPPTAVPGGAGGTGVLPPVLDTARGQLLAASSAGVQAYELGCSPCTPRWTPRWTSTVPATAVAVAGDEVVVATGTGEVQLLDAATGTPRASALVDFGSAQVAVGGGTIVVRAPQRLWAFDGCATTECPRSWVSSVPAHGQPVIAGDLVYVNSAADPGAAGTTRDVYRRDGCGRPACAPIARLAHPGETTGVVVSGGLIVTRDAVLGLPAAPG
jgi:outer membrane protein assembly factor BamB